MVCLQDRPHYVPRPYNVQYSGGHQVPKAPLRAPGVTSRAGTSPRPGDRHSSAFIAPTGHVPILNPPTAYGCSLLTYLGSLSPPARG
jgi:hypothetical protein